MIKVFLVLFILSFSTVIVSGQSRYEIPEGQDKELLSIDIRGNNTFSDYELLLLIRSKQTNNFFYKFLHSIISNLGGPAINYDSENGEIDLEILTAFYKANGFFDVEVKDSLELTNSGINLIYIVEEGPAYKYSNLSVYGVSAYPQNWKITSQLKNDTTLRFSESDLQSKIVSSLQSLLNDGYLFATYDSTFINVDSELKKTDVGVFFTLGKRYRIGNYIIEKSGTGSPEISKELIEDLINIEPNTFYNLEKIRQAQQRLFRTGLFSTLSLEPAPGEAIDTLVPLSFNGTIGRMNELGPEIIANNLGDAFNLGLGISYIRKNFFGSARKFELKPSFSFKDLFTGQSTNIVELFNRNDTTTFGNAEVLIKVEQPNLFGEPIIGSVDFTSRISKNRYPEIINYTENNIRFAFEFELPQFTFFNFLTTYYQLSSIYGTFLLDNELLSGGFTNASLGVEARSTSANNVIFPTEGYNLETQIQEINLFPFVFSKLFGAGYDQQTGYKIQISYFRYHSLNHSNTAIFAWKTKSGYFHAFENKDALSLFNLMFYAGGSNSIRGWRAREFPKTLNDGGSSNAIGGRFLTETSLELRLRPIVEMGGAVFLDFGNVFSGIESVKIDDFAVALGVGYRYYTPFAAIRIDFGFKFYDPYDRRSVFNKQFFDVLEFHFGIGEAF